MIYISAYIPSDSVQNRTIEHRLGRKLLEYGLKKEFGRSYIVTEEANHKPFLLEAPHIDFNISHTMGLVVCAIGNRDIGIDAELIRPFEERLLRRVCSKKEQDYVLEVDDIQIREERFFRLWTLKESFVKAIGRGIAFSLKDISFTIEENGIIKSSVQGFRYAQVKVSQKYILSVCMSDLSMEEKIMTYEEVFEKVKELFGKADVSKVEEHLAFQFNIQGEGEGAFYAEVKDGELFIEPYEYFDRDAVFICSAETLFKLASGKLDPVVAFTTGKLKVEGSIDQALKLQKLL